MNDLRDLYQEVILDHNRQPRNFRSLAGATHHARGHNPLCGDKLDLYLVVEDDVVKDVSFQGSGCAISTASASLMTESIKGKTLAEVEALFGRMHDLLTGRGDGAAADHEGEHVDIGKLAVFSGVRDFPVRVKCATLAWHTLHAALEDRAEPATTE